MKLSYAICVCDEAKELYSLIAFLKKVKDPEDEINILVDSAHTTPEVRGVLKHFEKYVVQNDRDFDGKFATHRNYHLEKCDGDYIFQIDADEMPQETLIKNLKGLLQEQQPDTVWVPRINIHPGSTEEWLKKCNFKVNDMGWINWPDMQCRIIKKSPDIRYGRELHEMIEGAKLQGQVPMEPRLALWHIKSVEKQDIRWDAQGQYVLPSVQMPHVEISIGELVDKITILELKKSHANGNTNKLVNIQKELDILSQVSKGFKVDKNLKNQLYTINSKLWNIEDEIRQYEQRQEFGDRFIELARSVYITNDERSRIKRLINVNMNSNIIEEKIYS